MPLGHDLLELPAPLNAKLSRLGLRFLADFLAVETARHPRNIDALAELGQIYSRLGEWEHGLEVDRQLVRLVPENPTVHYNLACSLAILGQTDPALDALEQAVGRGYADAEYMLDDSDLESLRNEPRFVDLIVRLRQPAARER
jgi:tetratricopeptide (TPR) repeat protein